MKVSIGMPYLDKRSAYSSKRTVVVRFASGAAAAIEAQARAVKKAAVFMSANVEVQRG
jgi:hypothetical protein